MNKRTYLLLGFFTVASLAVKLWLIFRYGNELTLYSDDINYVKSAVYLLKQGTLIYHEYNEPSVFIMPVYPLFLAAVFRVAGYGFTGLQTARVIQAFLSCFIILLAYLTARRLFDNTTGLSAAFLAAAYIPNITTAGYFLTETVFTLILLLLVQLSLVFEKGGTAKGFALIGVVWAAATLCRPVIALYPVLLYAYYIIHSRYSIKRIARTGLAMSLAFLALMAPWWVRNYREYGEFIPLSASSGNPMLQGTYINYEQTPENVVYYEMGNNYIETNRNEMEAAKKRISSGFRRDFWSYFKWYAFGKTYYFWGTVFYWKSFFGITSFHAMLNHLIILSGLLPMLVLSVKRSGKYLLPVLIMLYFNLTHCVYMAFDRYAYPLIPLLSAFSAFLFVSAWRLAYRRIKLALSL